MYTLASNACDEPNSMSPLPPDASAKLIAGAALFQNAFPRGNAALNDLVVAMGGNPTSISGTDPIPGDAGVPTTGQPIPAFPAMDRLAAFRANGGNWSRAAGRWNNSRSGNGAAGDAAGIRCVPPVASQPVTFIPLPPVVLTPPPPAAPKVAAPAAPASAPVCTRQSWPGSGLLPARDFLTCTIDGQYSCGWNEYMESLNYDRPWPNDAAKAAAQAKYALCLAKGNKVAGYSNNASTSPTPPGLAGTISDALSGSASPVVWGSLGAAAFLAWALFYQKGRK